MLFTIKSAAAVLATASLVAAQPHRAHRHAHMHKRAADDGGAVVLAFEMDGQLVSEADVCKGIQNGSLEWAPGTEGTPDCAKFLAPPQVTTTSTTSTPTPTSAAAASSAPPAHKFIEQTSSAAPAIASPAAVVGNLISGLTGLDAKIASNPNVGVPFQDGTVDCSHFPSDYGAIPIDWMNVGGWSGIQYVNWAGTQTSYISTAVPGGLGCAANPETSNTYCSYACPPGYQKSQWPVQTGGTSIGGLECKGGKLYRTNQDYSTLCIKGQDNVHVQNKLGQNAAICRTDYPGTENMNVPTNTYPGSTVPLTCPNSASYYMHQGKGTSAQYYLNNAGVPVDQACAWGSVGSGKGNWAPIIMGVGTDGSGNGFMSIFANNQNAEGQYVPLNFNVEIVGGSTACFYKSATQQFCTGGTLSSPSGCKGTGGDSPGCTVSHTPQLLFE
jgi:hypothetical protein